MVSAYLDTSVIIPLFLDDVFSEQAEERIASQPALLVADWAAVEVSSGIARQVRIGTLSTTEAQNAYAAFDQWRATATGSAETTPADMLAAIQFVRRADLALRGPDALHLANCARLGAKLLTFDARLTAAANELGLAGR